MPLLLGLHLPSKKTNFPHPMVCALWGADHMRAPGSRRMFSYGLIVPCSFVFRSGVDFSNII